MPDWLIGLGWHRIFGAIRQFEYRIIVLLHYIISTDIGPARNPVRGPDVQRAHRRAQHHVLHAVALQPPRPLPAQVEVLIQKKTYFLFRWLALPVTFLGIAALVLSGGHYTVRVKCACGQNLNMDTGLVIGYVIWNKNHKNHPHNGDFTPSPADGRADRLLADLPSLLVLPPDVRDPARPAHPGTPLQHLVVLAMLLVRERSAGHGTSQK
jgi:hypothetical protein